MRCQSRAYMIRERDGQGVLYQCFRDRGECKGRLHKNGLGSDAGAWTGAQGMKSLAYLARDLVVTFPRRFAR